MRVRGTSGDRGGWRRLGKMLAGTALIATAAGGVSCAQFEDPVAADPRPARPGPVKPPVPLFEDDARDVPSRARPAGSAGVVPAAWKEEGAPAAGGAGGGATAPKKEAAAGAIGEAGTGRASPREPAAARAIEVVPAPEPQAREAAGASASRPAASSVPARGKGGGRAGRGGDKGHLDDLFQTYRKRFAECAARPASDPYAAIERADLEAKLIALFFLRDKRKLEDYRDVIRSFDDEGPSNAEVELLKAALYQRVGQPDLRDRAIERAAQAAAPGAGGGLKVAGLAFAKEIRGYRSFTPVPAAEFAAGDELLLYGEIEGFRNAPAGRTGAATAYRRSFGAELVLRDAAGGEVDRRVLLRAGQAVEVVEDAAKPVHFWGRYPLPARLAAGNYRLEIEARDLEGGKRAKAAISLAIREPAPAKKRGT